jgi:carboxypeptidase C (cathepsin A)
MLGDWMKNFDPPIPAMLQAGVRVMIYAGAEDFICNWVGNQRWVDSLPWYGKGQWAATTEQEWMVDGESAGTAKAVGPLSFVKVDAAGHMVRTFAAAVFWSERGCPLGLVLTCLHVCPQPLKPFA